MHNWCTNKNLTGETCFFLLLLLVFWQYICCFCCFQIRFKFTFSPLFKSLDCFSSLPVFPLEPESRRNWGAKKSRKIRSHDFRNKCFPVERLSFFFSMWGGGCLQRDMACEGGGGRCWRRGRSIWVLIKREFISPLRSPLATNRSIYKSNRLFASQSPVIYDPAPLTRPASFHFC